MDSVIQLDPQLLAGFHRQRRSLLAVSLVLLAFQGLRAEIRTINLFGNSIELSSALQVLLPLWVAWFYFLIRYYQYLRDLGDKGIKASYSNRLELLAERKARKTALEYLPIDLAGLAHPVNVRLEIKGFVLMSSKPPPWQFAVRGAIHIDERSPVSKGRMQVFDEERFVLPERKLRVAKIRSVWWVLFHTRLFTEYGLPLVVAAVPVIRSVLVWLRVLKAAV